MEVSWDDIPFSPTPAEKSAQPSYFNRLWRNLQEAGYGAAASYSDLLRGQGRTIPPLPFEASRRQKVATQAQLKEWADRAHQFAREKGLPEDEKTIGDIVLTTAVRMGLELPKFALFARSPIAGFGAMAGLEMAGQDASPAEIARATAAGATTGAVFRGAQPLAMPQRVLTQASGLGAVTAIGGGTPKEIAESAVSGGVLGLLGPTGGKRFRDLRPITKAEFEEIPVAAASEVAPESTISPPPLPSSSRLPSVSARPIPAERVIEWQNLRSQISTAEPGGRVFLDQEGAGGTKEVRGYGSTFPIKNLAPKKTQLQVIDKALSGKPLTQIQRGIFDRMRQHLDKQKEGWLDIQERNPVPMTTGDLNLKVGDEVRVPGDTLWVTKATPSQIVLRDGITMKVDPVFDKIDVVGGKAGITRAPERGTTIATEASLAQKAGLNDSQMMALIEDTTKAENLRTLTDRVSRGEVMELDALAEIKRMVEPSGGTIVYRGGDSPLDYTRGGNEGISVSTKKEVAGAFTPPGGGVVSEALLPSHAKILREGEIPKPLQESYIAEAQKLAGLSIVANPSVFKNLQKSVLQKQRIIVDYARSKGYDAVDFPFEEEIRIIKPGLLKELKASQPALTEGLPAIEAKNKERGFITSVKESPQIAPKVKESVQGTYQPITNVETMARAQRLVETNPNEAMLKIAEGTADADYTATALAIINKAQRTKDSSTAARVAEQAAKKLTQGGQFIQAASMLDKLTPEGVLVYASRRIGKGKLSGPLAEKFAAQAEKIQSVPINLPYNKFLETQKLAEMIAKETPRSKMQVGRDWLLEIANLPRTVMSSFFDFSFGLRQGMVVLPKFPMEFLGAFKAQFKPFLKEQNYVNLMNQVMTHPDFKLASESKVAFSDINLKLAGREERYMSSLAEKIPLLKYPVRATNRAYTAMANKLRMDTFSTIVNNAEKVGLKPRENEAFLRKVATLVNDITGRGDLPKTLEQAAPLLNAFFYSPRLISSRLNLLVPVKYVAAPPKLRMEYLKTMLAFGSTITTILGLASLNENVTVEKDPRNADWGKIKIGNTRVDIMGGMQQYVRMAAQLISGKYISSTTGKIITLGEGYKPLTRKEILIRGIESKEAPVFSFITSLLEGQDFEGEKISVPKEIGKRFVPMLASDLYEIAEDDPTLLPLGFLGALGVGLQTYGQPEAYTKLKEINSSANPERAFRELKMLNPKLAEKVKTTKLQENFTEFDWGLTYMGVENGNRAAFLFERFKKMPADKAKTLYNDLREKRLISARVEDQLRFLRKGK